MCGPQDLDTAVSCKLLPQHTDATGHAVSLTQGLGIQERMTLFFFENSKQNHQLRINGQEKLEVKESVEWWENSEKGRFRKKQQK